MAESTEPRNQPEPLFSFTVGMVEVDPDTLTIQMAGIEPPAGEPRIATSELHGRYALVRVVAPPAPATERVPLAFVRGRRLPDGRALLGAAQAINVPAGWAGYLANGEGSVPLDVDDDGTVEVLTEGTDKP